MYFPGREGKKWFLKNLAELLIKAASKAAPFSIQYMKVTIVIEIFDVT